MVACTICTLTILHAETFVKVTDASTLQDGDKVIMGCKAKGEVSAGFSSTYKFLDAVTATFTDDKATLDNPKVITLKKSGSYWNLYIGSKVIGHASGSSDLDGQKCRYTTKFAISFGTNGTANIVSQTPGADNAEVFFNHHNTMSRFSLYKASSNQTPIELYKLDESTIPEVKPSSVELNKNTLELRVGGTETLTATVKPVEAEDKTIAWGTTDASIATVDNGVVTAVAKGMVKIWVKATAVENVSDTCVVTVLPAAAVGNATYNAVQKAEYLPTGAKVFFGTIKDGENYVMGQYVSGNNIKGEAATYGEKRHSVTAPLQVAYTVEKDGNYYIFVDHDGKYLRTLSSSKLGSGTELDDYAKWTLGAFDEDDATVVLTNKANSSKGIYNNWQGTNDMFNIYDGVGDGTNLAKIILYSDKALDWVEREKDPWMKVDATTLDWGKQEPDEYTNDWGDTRYLNITMNDLPANIEVELTEDGNGTFNCWTGTISKSKTSEKLLIEWEATQVGVYEGKLTLTCPGLETIEVVLKAEAVAKGSGGGGVSDPELTVSTDHIYINLVTNTDYYDTESFYTNPAEYTFKFSAKNLAKNLRLKWHRNTTESWMWASEKMNLYMAYDVAPFNYIYEDMTLNANYDLGTDNITDFEILIVVKDIAPQHLNAYDSDLQFESYKEGSKTDLAIDKKIPIKLIISENPTPDPWTATGMKSIQQSEVSTQKVIRDGQLVIIRNGERFTITGERIAD